MKRGPKLPPPPAPGTAPHVAAAERYVAGVLDGSIPAGRLTRLACARHRRDVATSAAGGRFILDAARAERACNIIELLPHIKGEKAKRDELIVLGDWQCFIAVSMFGWVDRKTGLRRFRKIYIEVARKNGKSTLLAAILIVLTFFDGEAGADGYSAATTRDQARIVFKTAQEMIRKCQELRERYGVDLLAHAIVQELSGSKIEALSADAHTLDGLNPHVAVVDEVHAHKSRKVWDVLETAQGARAQPMLVGITTAGDDISGICYEIRTYVVKILEQVATDDSTFGIIYTTDEAGVDIFQSLTALRRLDKLCSCRNVQTTKIEKAWREVCAERATTGNAEGILQSAAERILSDRSGHADSAERATTLGSESETQGTKSANLQTGGHTQCATQIGSRPPSGSTDLSPKTSARSSTRDGSRNTDAQGSGSTSSLRSKAAGAPSALTMEEVFAWITVTARELFEGFSASDATLQSAFSETLKRAFSEHSPTCGAKQARITDDGCLEVRREGDDWTTELAWRKANPNFGVSVYPEYLADLCRKAIQTPAAQANFKTKHLDVWVSSNSALYSVEAWKACARPELTREDVKDFPCITGLDLASTNDLCSAYDVYRDDSADEPVFYVLGRNYVPEDTIRASRIAQYPGWEETERLIATPGDSTDYQRIEDDLLDTELAPPDRREVVVDKYQSRHMATRLAAEGVTVVELAMNVSTLSEPTKMLDVLMRRQRILHDGDPLLEWAISNVVGHIDAKDNVYPRKERPENKIDPAIAVLEALSRWLSSEVSGPTVLETEGIRFA